MNSLDTCRLEARNETLPSHRSFLGLSAAAPSRTYTIQLLAYQALAKAVPKQ